MRYSGLILNDFTAAPGVSVTFFTQGCPHRCYGCHNPETWDFEGGQEFTNDVLQKIIEGITAQGIKRNLCIMGGEPLCSQNAFLTYLVIAEVKKYHPDTKIYIWTGYNFEDLINAPAHPQIPIILETADVLIDGKFMMDLRTTTTPLIGSSNQRIIDLKKNI